MRLNRAICCIIAVSVILTFPAGAAAQSAGFEILNTDVSARSAGMAGAFAGVSGDVNALFYNPAGLRAVQNRRASISYLDHVLDIKSGSFVVSLPGRGKNMYAAALNYINYGDFEGRDELGNARAAFSAQDIAAVGGFARAYSSRVHFGAAVKAFYSKIDNYSSSGFAADAGVMYFVPSQKLTLGASIANIGFVAQAYDRVKDDLPAAVKLGASKQLAHLPLLWSVEFRQFFAGGNQVVFGGEFSFSASLRGRAGYNSYGRDQKIGSEGGSLSGFSFGFGFDWKRYTIDYAYSSMGVIGNLNRLTVRMPL